MKIAVLISALLAGALALTAGAQPVTTASGAGTHPETAAKVAAPDARWHSIEVRPNPGRSKFHFYNKLNPVWWLENADEPLPPAWYLPGDRHRITKWCFRNPFHNFDFYVVGVADKTFVRSGRYPERNSNPHGGWDFEVARRKLVLLPFVCYERRWCTFYFGWREHGAFGLELRFHHKPATQVPAKAVS